MSRCATRLGPAFSALSALVSVFVSAFATALPFVLQTAALQALPGDAAAQVTRNFPQNALRGVIVFGQPPEVLLNGQDARLVPGSRIRDMNNMLAMSGALVGVKAVVNYTLDTQGFVRDVWILTSGEIARRPWPSTAEQAQSWSFDPVAQTWSKP